MVFSYIDIGEILALALTCRSFLSVCRKFGFSDNLETYARSYCHSRNGIKWLLACGSPTENLAAYVISQCDNEQSALDIIKWALEEEMCDLNKRTCKSAACKGYLEVLKWLRSQDPPCPWDEGTCWAAAYGGHLETLIWLRSQDPPCPCDERTYQAAAVGDHLEVLKWLGSQDPPCPLGV